MNKKKHSVEAVQDMIIEELERVDNRIPISRTYFHNSKDTFNAEVGLLNARSNLFIALATITKDTQEDINKRESEQNEQLMLKAEKELAELKEKFEGDDE